MLLFLAACSGAWAQSPVAPSAGDGLTTNTAYQITSLGNLAWMSDNVTSSTGTYYALQNDIDATSTSYSTYNGGAGFSPIGDGTYTTTTFQGVFDGGGHMISNLTINRTDNYVGLFGHIGSGGVVENLGLEGGSVTGQTYVGDLVGYNNGGTITNCYATGAVTGTNYVGGLVNYVGGLVGENTGSITNCHADGDVTGSICGGLVGTNGGTITGCYWDTTTSGKTAAAGTGSSAGATGLSDDAMKVQANFVGWDFTTVWGISSDRNAGYPYLRSIVAPSMTINNGAVATSSRVVTLNNTYIGCASGSHHKSEAISDETLVTRWRDKQVTIGQIESGKESPKGMTQWEGFKGVMRPGDELWHFCSPGPTWQNQMGWEGYAIFRGSRLVKTYTTREN